MGISAKDAPYPKPTKALDMWKRTGWARIKGEARMRKPRERMKAQGSKKARREIVRPLYPLSVGWGIGWRFGFSRL